MPAKLDRKLVKEVCGTSSQEFPALKALDVSKRDLNDVSGITFLPSLAKLDISHNALEDISGLAGCTSLRWLNLSSNQLTSVDALSELPQLQVLNISHNQIAGKLRLKGFAALCALIASDNAITVLKGLGEAARLNTLVLKSNRISTLGKALAPCTALAKLSVAHNQLSDIGDSLSTCKQLAELRVGHNQISQLPSSLLKNARLKIVELGGNNVESTSDIEVLRKLPHLASCSLKGCPIAEARDYQQQMQDLLPSLQILDGRKGSRSQTAPGGRDVGAEPAKAKKRKASLSKDQVEAPEGHVSEKTAKKRRVTLSEQQEELPQRNEEAAGTGQTGRMTEPKKGSKEIQAKSRKKEKKGKIPTAENGLRAAGHEGRLPGQADSEAAPEGSLSLEASQTRKLGVSQTGNKAGFSMHGKQGRKGAEIGAALQKGLLGTVMRPEEPLAPGWD